jgi:pimeloyl-ACP methyl ester carboxylesterase
VFIAAHSMGASMALDYLDGQPDAQVSGLVAIGASTGGRGSLDEAAGRLEGIRVPVLDLFGELDLEPVLNGAGTRAAVAAASGIEDFTQVEVPGADHFFDGLEERLLEAVSAWLEARR